MARKLNEDENLKLVQLYGENDCLWDIRSQNYRNKEMRTTALQNIAQQMNIEGLTHNEVKNKIKAIRATYYLELDKIQRSSRSGASGNVYVPKMKWFEELDAFIKKVTVKRKTTDNTGDSKNAASSADVAENENKSRSTESNTESNNISTNRPAPTSVTEAPNQSSTQRPKRSKLSQMAAIIKDMKSVSNDINMSVSVEETDFDIYGKHVAAQLKKLSEEQSVIAQEEIQKILSKCRLADIQTRTNMDIYRNTQFSSIHSSPQLQYRSTPSPATTVSSNSSLGFYPPQTNEIPGSSNSSLGFYHNQSVITTGRDNKAMNDNEVETESNTDTNIIYYAFESA